MRRDLVVQDDRLAALKINRNDVAVGQRDRAQNSRRADRAGRGTP